MKQILDEKKTHGRSNDGFGLTDSKAIEPGLARD
jgi:hypothetical protein